MQYLNHDCIFKIYLRLSFTQIICIIPNKKIRLRRGQWGKVSLLTSLLISPTLIDILLFALVRYFSFVLCKWQPYYKVHGHFIIYMLPLIRGLYRPSFVIRRRDTGYHRGSVRGRSVAYRDAPGHTVAPPRLYREWTVASASWKFVAGGPGRTGANRDRPWWLLASVRSIAGNMWTHSNAITKSRPGSPRSAGYKLPGRTGAYTRTVWNRFFYCLT